MPYATTDDVIALHGQRFVDDVADRDEDGEVDLSSVQAALVAAEAEINSRLSVRYQTPLASTPEIVKIAAVEIAVYRLANNGGALTDDIRKRYEDFIALFKDIAAGKANLGDPDLDQPAEPGDNDWRAPVAQFGTVSRI